MGAAPQRGFVSDSCIANDTIGLDGAMAPRSLIYGSRAAVVLFNSATAFPALSHTWIYAVLHAMQFPPKLISIINMMYTDLYTGLHTDMCYADVPVASTGLLSGMRQGCPLSGTVFALALDPFVRWFLMRPAFQGTHIFLYADDLANAMRVSHFCCVFCITGPWLSGLTPSPSNCVVLPLWDGDYTDLVAFVSSLPGLVAAALHTFARYLGVYL